MRSFYHYMMAYRGVRDLSNSRKQLAEWMFKDHDFPKQSTDYEEISEYLEFHSPFNHALSTFDEAWTEYIQNS